MKWSRAIEREEKRQTAANVKAREERDGVSGPRLYTVQGDEFVNLPGGGGTRASRYSRIDGWAITCDVEGCRGHAVSVHLLYGEERWPAEIMAACKKHDPGGYWFYIHQLRDEPLNWLTHLAQKGDAVQKLLAWLGYGPYEIKPSDKLTDCKKLIISALRHGPMGSQALRKIMHNAGYTPPVIHKALDEVVRLERIPPGEHGEGHWQCVLKDEYEEDDDEEQED